MNKLLALVCFACLPIFAGEDFSEATATKVVPGQLYSSHMVFQRDRPLVVYGTAEPGGVVKLAFDDERASTTVGTDGYWQARFSPRPAGGPHRLQIAGKDTTWDFNDILVGEVWFCSGQSNMDFPASEAQFWADEAPEANNYPQIRLFNVPRLSWDQPVREPIVAGPWLVCNGVNARDFSATAYYFGRELHKGLKIPVGVIESAWGGSRIEPWIPGKIERTPAEEKKAQVQLAEVTKCQEALRACYAFEADIAKQQDAASPRHSDSWWSHMIHLPTVWERVRTLNPNFDGYAAFKLWVDLPADWAGKELQLDLGIIDETDRSYFNGELVGSSGSLAKRERDSWQTPRHYRVPGKLVKAGKNKLMVFVGDLTGDGGFRGGEPMRLYPAGHPELAVSLENDWACMPVVHVPTWPSNMTGKAYNSMVVPFFPFQIRGVLWYQGESNAYPADVAKYVTQFPELINAWRKGWGYDFPFYFVQLPGCGPSPSYDNAGGRIRDAQRRTLDAVPNAKMVVAIDIGDPKNIHPKNKQELGRRLAQLAFRELHGYANLVAEGPLFDHAEYRGREVIVHFKKLQAPLVARGELAEFAIAGEDKKYFPAKAKIVGDTVVCEAAAVKEPKHVLYLHDGGMTPTLFNSAGFPAATFISEEWFR